MLLQTVKQLYDDLKVVASNHPYQVATKGVVAVFNTNLSAAKREHPNNEIIQSIPEADIQTVNGELLTMTGQILTALDEQARDEFYKNMPKHREDPFGPVW